MCGCECCRIEPYRAVVEIADASEELLDVVVHDVMVQALHVDTGARVLSHLSA